MEKSLFLLKPDGVINSEMKAQLSADIEKNNLSVTDRFIVQLTKQQIYDLWPRTYSDPIYGYLITKYLEKKDLELWLVQGDDAIKKAWQIKFSIRQTYCNSNFINCLHTPSNLNEYTMDYNIIINHKAVGNMVQTIFQFPEKSYQEASEVVWYRLQNETFSDYIQKITNKAIKEHKKLVVIDEDDCHLIDYYIETFIGFFTNMQLSDAYYYALCIDKAGCCPIYMSNNEEEISQIINFMKSHFLKVRIE